MYIPKKKAWASLSDFKLHLEKDTNEKIVSFNGYKLITETTEYGITHGQLSCNEVAKKSKIKKIGGKNVDKYSN